jgi:hypothetical protein
MVTIVKVRKKFSVEPNLEMLDACADTIMQIIDGYTTGAARTFHIELPTEEMLNSGNYVYMWIINITDASIDCKELFDYINAEVPLLTLDVINHKYAPGPRPEANRYYWTNDGSTSYHDGSTYTDPYYCFHANGFDDYEIVDMEVYAKKFVGRDKERVEKLGCKYTWRCTASWDNPLKAHTIEEAIEEFENIYREKLWKSIESLQERLASATNSFRNFDTYRRTKSGL